MRSLVLSTLDSNRRLFVFLMLRSQNLLTEKKKKRSCALYGGEGSFSAPVAKYGHYK